MKKLKVELHTHTKWSYDVDTSYYEIIDKCIKEEIDVLAVTDHNEIEGAFRLKELAPFEVIIGEEILTKSGEIIGLFLKKYIDSGLSMFETIKEIKRQGGVVYLPHPFDKTTRKTAANPNDLGKLIDKVDIIEVYNGRTIYSVDNKSALELASKIRKIKGIGSDAHTKYEYGRNYLMLDEFKSASEFVSSMRNAEYVTNHFIPWVFLFTKWARFKKRELSKYMPDSKVSTSNVNCDLCGSNRFIVLYEKHGSIPKKYLISDDSYGVHSRIVKCMECDLIYSSPRENDAKLISRYSEFKDYTYENERSARKVSYKRILERINDQCPKKGRLLDIGCATGAFVEIATKNGWKAEGVDPSKWATDYGVKQYGLNLNTGTLRSKKYPSNSFDCIVCIDVIEHVDSPDGLLKDIFGLLKKNGLLVLVTPDKGSVVAKLLGEKWWHIRPDHIYYLTKKTVKSYLIKNEFVFVKFNRYKWTFSFEYWISRLENSMNSIYRIVKYFARLQVMNFITKRYYSINFHDSLEIYAKKN